MNGIVGEGFNLLFFGMGFVFFFLTMLVFITQFVSYIVGRLEPSKNEQTSNQNKHVVSSASNKSPAHDSHIAAVIAASIQRYRKDKQR